MLLIDDTLTPAALRPRVARLFERSEVALERLLGRWDPAQGAPVYTVAGRYTSRDWTEWTLGFHYGAALLQFEATGDAVALQRGRAGLRRAMVDRVSHVGVHDHGFNIVGTFGTLWRLVRAGRAPDQDGDLAVCELALRVSGAIQAARWTPVAGGGGFIYSFNGPHSLFIDTMRSLRSLALAHRLGHRLYGEGDQAIDLLDRLLDHAATTARYNIYYGEQRDAYDVAGRVAHEAIFNITTGAFRCPATQQGYSPFTTWTRGLAWALLGFAEQLEFLQTLTPTEWADRDPAACLALLERPARATADYYLATTPTDGVPYWDTGAPGLTHLGDYLNQPADPFNDHEPVDSSAAAIVALGLLRLGRCLAGRDPVAGQRYWQAGLTVARTVLDEPYLATDPAHEGLLLHGVYHRPNGWDHVPAGARTPRGEAVMWGDYHLRELGVVLLRAAAGEGLPTFFDAGPGPSVP